jgi:hypothetical protein
LKWINLGFNELENRSISVGLKKSIFAFAKNTTNGKRVIPVIRYPKKKTIEQLWGELFPEEDDQYLLE